ncbi:ATP-binding protein [Halorussus salilacus]|uniref:ATP-binding protein n=1 Tax=Halorussus salilacus TaxID=2953750 RepID=UPI0020A04698|nr:ATP-binding protein [Halorussus salilacus]USZ68515.1 ATP-binding protein [Halorussus salilacus]
MANPTPNSEVSEGNSKSRDGASVAYATPSRKTYNSVASDISVESALGELVDNSLDSAALHGINPVEITINIEETDDGTMELVYRDESGGVKEDEMGVFMGLGRSKNERAGGQNVGTFGMGAKRALKRLGDEFTIASHYKTADTGWKYTVSPEWFDIDPEEDNPNQWQFEMDAVDLGQGVTEIRVRNLNFNWDNRKEKIEDWFSKTYQKFLQEESDVDLDLALELEGDEVETPEPVEWSFAPWFGGLHPRTFEGLVFQDENWNDQVQVKVTVGLLREGAKRRTGTFIFCQNRLVEGNLTDEKGGYGLSGGLPKFKTSQIKRLRIEIELFGDANDLPWSADKSRLRPSHKVLTPSPEKGVYWWLRRMADRHMKAGRYGNFDHIETKSVFEPYGSENESAANDGEIEVVDVGDKQRRLRRGEVDHIRISQKPGTDYTTVDTLGKIATAHARLGVVAESMSDIQYDEWARPTYEDAVGREFVEAFYEVSDREFSNPVGKALLQVDTPEAFMSDVADAKEWARIAQNLTSVGTVPPMSNPTVQSDENLGSALTRLQAAADESATTAEYRTEGEAWRVPRYEAELKKALQETNDDLSFDELEDIAEPIIAEEETPTATENEQTDESETVTTNQSSIDDSVNETDERGGEADSDYEQDEEVGTVEQTTTSLQEYEEEVDGSTSEETNSDRMTLVEFYRRHDDLLADVPDDIVSDDEQLEEHLVEKLEIANAFNQAQAQVGQGD